MKKKPKLSLGEGGAKGFLIRHVEKMVLGVCVLLVAVFFYFGWSTEGLPGSKTPPKLAEEVTQAKNVIKEPRAEEVIEGRKPTSDFVARSKEILQPTSGGLYAIRPISPSKFGSTEKRGDPELLPPRDFEFTAVTGPIPVRPYKGAGADLLASLPDAKAPEPKKPRKPEKPAQDSSMGLGYDEYSAEGSSRNRRRGGRNRGNSSAGGSEMMMEMMDSYSGEMGDMYSMGTPSGVAEKKNYPGYRPAGVGMSGDYPMETMPASSTMSTGTNAASSLLPESRSFVVGKLVAPLKEQFTKYEEVFSNSAGYLPQRDRPRYVWVEVDRIDVTDNPSAPVDDSTAWKRVIDTRFAYLWATEVWAGIPQEIGDRRYLNADINLPAPPLMIRDLDPLLLHSKVPLANLAALQAAEKAKKQRERELPPEVAAEAAKQAAGATAANSRTRPGAAAPAGPGSYSRRGAGGMMGGYGNEMMGGYGDSYGDETMAVDSYGPEMSGSQYGGGEMMMGMGGGYGGYGSYGGAAQLAEVVDYQQVRFSDFTVVPGRVYRYRVRLWVEDPNNPEAAQAAPRPQDLTAEALERLRAAKAADDAANKKLASGQPRQRTWWRVTPWSEPTDLVKVPLPNRQFAGDMKKRNTRTVGDAEIEVAPPTGKLMVVGWDSKYACDVPKEAEVMRGSVMNFAGKFDVLHPISLKWKEIENYKLRSDALVLDLRGGNYTFGYKDGDKDSPVMEPAEFAIFDASGNFKIRNELDDAEKFDLFEPNPPPAAPAGGMPGMSGSDYESGYQDMMNMGSYR